MECPAVAEQNQVILCCLMRAHSEGPGLTGQPEGQMAQTVASMSEHATEMFGLVLKPECAGSRVEVKRTFEHMQQKLEENQERSPDEAVGRAMLETYQKIDRMIAVLKSALGEGPVAEA